jgi:hypothetical protein
MEGKLMNWNKVSGERLGHPAPLLRAASIAVAGVLLTAACSTADAAGGTSASATSAVKLSPSSGSTTSTPTWSTSAACPSGLQGSAILRAVNSDGTTYDWSRAVNGAYQSFGGALQGTVQFLQGLGDIGHGGTQELVVECFAGQALTGKSAKEMHIFIHFSADGKSYSTSATRS